jgi:RNA polymerase sigma factor (sigma-70 family)
VPGADTAAIERAYRDSAGRAVAILTRFLGDLDLAEEAVQEAYAIAMERWPADGIPPNSGGWIVTTARNKALDRLRRESSRYHRETQAVLLHGEAEPPEEVGPVQDDRLRLIFTCCHPALARSAQVALTLRLLGGLSTPEIARCFLVPEATMAQRVSRAKAAIRAGGLEFDLPRGEGQERLHAVRHVLYLIFNEGYTASSGEQLTGPSLSGEAIRLARLLHRLVPDDAETSGLLALMLLTEARRPARTGPDGALIPLAEQDRTRWTPALIAEGVALVSTALPRGEVGPYQLQAAIAAVHDEAATAAATDWPQILALYDVLTRVSPGPVVTLNRAVAVAMVHGPLAGLAELGTLDGDERIARGHRLDAVRAHLLELSGDRAGAVAAYRRAAKRAASIPEQHYLALQAARLS